MEPLVVTKEGAVAVVTLQRPERRNALDPALLSALWSTMVALDADAAVAAVVLTGADPAFCAGLDLSAVESGELDVAAALRRADAEPGAEPGAGLPSPVPPMSTPLIGAVNGVAVTGGLELALCCDFLVASERARFADTHTRVGVQPFWGLTVNLAEAVGTRRAREMSTTGNFVDAATALSWGLVNHVVPHGELLPYAVGLARDVASNEAGGVTRILATYRESSEPHRTTALRREVDVAADWVARHPITSDDIARRRADVKARARQAPS